MRKSKVFHERARKWHEPRDHQFTALLKGRGNDSHLRWSALGWFSARFGKQYTGPFPHLLVAYLQQNEMIAAALLARQDLVR